jgi:outer membrane receptor protein involved in Fe transport
VLGNAVVPGATVGSFPNTNLGWEQSKQLDIGFDLSILNGKVNFTGEYYRKLNYQYAA